MDNRKPVEIVENRCQNGQSERLSDVKCVSLKKTIYRTYDETVDFVINFRTRCFKRGMRSEIDDRSHVYSIRGVDSIRKANSRVGGLIHVYLVTDTLPDPKSDVRIRNVTLYRTTP